MPMRPVARSLVLALAVTMGCAAAPNSATAQSGTWVATITQMSSAGGTAELTIQPRNDKQSRARIVLHNTKRDMRLAWDIVEGSCRDEGKPVAAQAAFITIQTQLDGSGTATANIPKLESGKRYYVRVFDPQTAARDASAFGCANISEKP
jgi:hypothetical protein